MLPRPILKLHMFYIYSSTMKAGYHLFERYQASRYSHAIFNMYLLDFNILISFLLAYINVLICWVENKRVKSHHELICLFNKDKN